ncbi:TIGR02281 family clan AA aspartic protease [Amylibacter sp. IMCC11727]|uniref:retropepsin-like aspartic protease family protein n=1 Tax=Amylibacter sp. IMCC11727 TaxID=3039851 RepID=UPI00244DC192|nr:TIGR02281 family clan AA aspartic protease [Amylibacter sp. IMCC11727]WGI21042.1 TIGR02281 family clan AA aspartic protease [Amylibacter sp. IMCC11727]
MRWIYLAIVAVLGIVFWRKDVQLIDLVLNANLKWSLAVALFLGGIIAGQLILGAKSHRNTARWAFWGVFVVGILGLLEYSVEWRQKTLIANNETIVLSAASVETVTQHFVPMRDGLFETEATINGLETRALIDTGASLVLLNYETAQAAGIDVDALSYDTPVRTAAGLLDIATISLTEIRVGTRILATDVDAAITPKGLDHSNLLGISFLSQLDEAVVANNQVILKQTR